MIITTRDIHIMLPSVLDDNYSHSEHGEEGTLRPSKTQLKRNSADLQVLGEELLKLTHQQLVQMELPEALYEAVCLGQRITARGGLKRQRKFIGQLLRHMDVGPVRSKLVTVTQHNAESVRLQHLCEKWRDRMIQEEGLLGMNEFVGQYPGVDRQKLRQLVRESKSEQTTTHAVGPAPRRLFRFIRDVIVEKNTELPSPGETLNESDNSL